MPNYLFTVVVRSVGGCAPQSFLKHLIGGSRVTVWIWLKLLLINNKHDFGERKIFYLSHYTVKEVMSSDQLVGLLILSQTMCKNVQYFHYTVDD